MVWCGMYSAHCRLAGQPASAVVSRDSCRAKGSGTLDVCILLIEP